MTDVGQWGCRRLWTGIIGILLGGLIFAVLAPPLHAQLVPVTLWWITFDRPADLAHLAATYDVWEVDHARQRALLALSDAEARTLAATHTLEAAADQSPLSPAAAAAQQSAGIPGYACYRTVAETDATLTQWVADHPNLAALVDIGDSWDKTQPGGPAGHDLTVLVLTNRHRHGDKFRLMVMGAIHARELVTAEVAVRFAEELLAAYGTDPAITWLLDHGEVHILPIANPDGRLFAEEGLLWRKNTNDDTYCEPALPFVSYGVDLNRNSSFQWNGCLNCSSGNPCAATYRGTAPASEPEVQAIQAYMTSIFPDARGDDLDAGAPETTPGIFITLHSYGQLILYPWGWSDTPAPNATGLATLAQRFADRLDYVACQGGAPNCLYPTDGTTDDWAYGTRGVASFTFELGTDFFQACSDFETTIAPQTLATLHDALTWAARPYQLPHGPLAGELTTGDVDAQGQLTVTFPTTQTLGTPVPKSIMGGRLTLDDAPWQTGTPVWTLAASDGKADSHSETLTATIDTRCLPNGPHTLIAQAQDEDGSWGSPAFAQVSVAHTRTFTVSATGTMQTIPNVPVRHFLTITNHSAVTDTFRLTRSSRVAGNIAMTFPQSVTQPLAPGAGAVLPVDVVSSGQNKTAAQTAAVIDVFSLSSPQQCQQAILRTAVAPAHTYFLPWLPVARPE